MGQASMRKWEARALASLREMRGSVARATSANLGGVAVSIPVTAWEIRHRSLGLRQQARHRRRAFRGLVRLAHRNGLKISQAVTALQEPAWYRRRHG